MASLLPRIIQAYRRRGYGIPDIAALTGLTAQQVVDRAVNPQLADPAESSAAVVKGSAFLSATIPGQADIVTDIFVDIPWEQNPTWSAPNVSVVDGKLRVTVPGVYRLDGIVVLGFTGPLISVIHGLNDAYDYGFGVVAEGANNTYRYHVKAHFAVATDDAPVDLPLVRLHIVGTEEEVDLTSGLAYMLVDRMHDFDDDGSYAY